MEVEVGTVGAAIEEERELSNRVICKLTDSEGTPLGAPIFLPESAGPKELQQLVNKLLNNEEKLPYAFYVSDHELVVQLGLYLQKNKVSVEKVITIVYQPQAVFRIRPVTRCSSTIAEMNAPSPDYNEDNGEEAFLDESDIINEYDIDEEELPDADEEGGSDGEEEFDGADDSIHIFTGHTGELYVAASSPTDPTLVATGGGDDKGFLWKIGHGDWAFELQGHQDSVSSLSFSADGQLVASGSLDGVVKIWDVAKRELKCTLEGPAGGIEWLRWHSKGHLILAGSEDSNVWMWNADNASFLNFFTGHAGSVTCGDFTPDGKTICSGSDDATMKIWNPRAATAIHTVRGHPYHTEGLTCLTINSDSTLVLTGSSDGSIHVVNISTGKVVSSLISHTDSVECAAFEPSSRRDSWRAATGGMDKKLIIWDQHSTPRCICDHEEGVACLLWLAGSRYIATGCLDGKVRIWDSLSGDCVKLLSGHSDAIQSIAVSSSGEFLVSVSIDGTARAFEIGEFRSS